MLLRTKIKDEPGFQYVVENLECMSSAARRLLMEQPWINDIQELEHQMDLIAQGVALLQNPNNTKQILSIRHKFMELHDIGATLKGLSGKLILNEIEFFEIKQLARLYREASHSATEIGWDQIPHSQSIEHAFEILDPDHTGMANFYLYDTYDERLAPIRKQLKLTPEDANLFAQHETIQKEVMVHLSDELYPLAKDLTLALNRMAAADLLLAKAQQAIDWNLCRPILNKDTSTPQAFTDLFNPRLRHHNESLQLRYQPVNVELHPGVCLITGANMAGKTVFLKTLGIAQLMLQFGFFVPASKAQMALVEDVVFCIGDQQNEMNGLSSFASEIIKISQTIGRAEKDCLLILIDEPARTTNPIEGKAIVQSISNLLDQQTQCTTLITTHYSQLNLTCRRLRVRGFVESMSQAALTPENINQFMDYSLLPDNSDEVPHEALRIAQILGCHEQMIAQAKELLQ